MSYFKAEMHQIRFRQGFRPRQTPLRELALAALFQVNPLTAFKWHTSKGKEGREKEGKREGRDIKGIGRAREEKGAEPRKEKQPQRFLFGLVPCPSMTNYVREVYDINHENARKLPLM